jgi:hypothetical protein
MADSLFNDQKKSLGWNLFLFNLCVSLADEKIILKNYSDVFGGSWIIETENKKIIYDGREDILTLLHKVDNVWKNTNAFYKNELSLSSLKDLYS